MWLLLLTILVGVGLVTWLAIRYCWVIGLGGALIVLPLLPVLAGLRVYEQGTMTHNRYLYLPSVGLSFLFGLVLKQLSSRSTVPKAALMAVSAILLVLCGYLTFAQQKFYGSDETFYQRAIEIAPNNVLVLDYLGDTYMKHGEPELAMTEFREAYRLAPSNARARFSLANGLFKTGDYGTAETLFDALSRDEGQPLSKLPSILLTTGIIKMRLGRMGEAETVLQALERRDSEYPGLHRTLGRLYQMRGEIVRAQAEYAKEFSASGDPEAGRQAVALAEVLGWRSRPPIAVSK